MNLDEKQGSSWRMRDSIWTFVFFVCFTKLKRKETFLSWLRKLSPSRKLFVLFEQLNQSRIDRLLECVWWSVSDTKYSSLYPWSHRIASWPVKSSVTCSSFLKFLLACTAGGFVAGALKKRDIRSPFSLLCGQVYFIVSIVLQRDDLFKDVQFWKGINNVVVNWSSDDDDNADNEN